MTLPSFVVGDPDRALPVWVEWHSLKFKGLQRASIVLMEAHRLLHGSMAFLFGDPPPWRPCAYCCLVVGFDLGWYVDPLTGVRPVEVAPFRADLGPAATQWDRRSVFVDSDHDYRDGNGNRVTIPGPMQLAKLCAHGLGHLVGVGHTDGEPWDRPDLVIPGAGRAAAFCRAGRAN